MTIKTTSIMIIHIKRESDFGGNERSYSEKQRERKGGGGGVTNKNGIHFGSFFREQGKGMDQIQFKEKQQKTERGYSVYLRG